MSHGSKISAEDRITELEAALRGARDAFHMIGRNYGDRFLVSSLSSLNAELVERALNGDKPQKGGDPGS